MYNEVINKVNTIAVYLRKSREDVEYEKKSNDYDTLLRHRTRLLSYAKELNIKVSENDIYEEIVSGDSIAERPIIQKLLIDIETKFDAVLVIDVQRLTRGGYTDQGRIIDTFKYTNTLIITPDKTFDLNNKADEEYFADKLNFSRKEYDHIKRRLTEGRIDSVKEGKFIGGFGCFGYEKYKLPNEKGFSLRIIPEQAEIVRLIFKLCLEGKGTYSTATYLNNLGIKTQKSTAWSKNTIKQTLRNKTYCGYVKWQERKTIKIVENGIVRNKTIRTKDYLAVKGRHEPIISEEDFNKVQEKLKNCSTKYVPESKELLNPLAGILRCSHCNTVMARNVLKGVYWRPRANKEGKKYVYPVKPIVYCTNKKECKTVSHTLEHVENMIIEGLKDWLKENKEIVKDYDKNNASIINTVLNQLDVINKEIDKEQKKLNRIMDFLEDGTYDKETYNARSKSIIENIQKLEYNKSQISENNEQLKIERIKSLIPKVEKCIKTYSDSDTKQKNELLHSVLVKVLYTKTKERKDSDLSLDFYPKI